VGDAQHFSLPPHAGWVAARVERAGSGAGRSGDRRHARRAPPAVAVPRYSDFETRGAAARAPCGWSAADDRSVGGGAGRGRCHLGPPGAARRRILWPGPQHRPGSWSARQGGASRDPAVDLDGGVWRVSPRPWLVPFRFHGGRPVPDYRAGHRLLFLLRPHAEGDFRGTQCRASGGGGVARFIRALRLVEHVAGLAVADGAWRHVGGAGARIRPDALCQRAAGIGRARAPTGFPGSQGDARRGGAERFPHAVGKLFRRLRVGDPRPRPPHLAPTAV